QIDAKRTEYLLGLGSEAERAKLESEYFSDEDTFHEMLTAEDDLIDAYARGELSTEEHRLFEKHFLTSAEARERVRFARDLNRAVVRPRQTATKQSVTQTPATGLFSLLWRQGWGLRVGFATAALVVVVVFAWLLVERARMTNELRELRAERARLSELTEDLQR